MGPILMRSIVLMVLCLAARIASAADWELDLDTRLVTSNAGKSFVDGGLSSVRFSEQTSGFRLGRARFAVAQAVGEVWAVRVDASAWGNEDKSPISVTEAYLQFRPYPYAGYRLRVKAGAFHAPISLENRASGWESPYTLSYSAINSWLAEEVRTIGVEGQLDWLGTRLGHSFELGATGGVFGWNEGAGIVLANDGFVLHDRQTPVFGRVGRRGVEPLSGAEPFREIDGRAGVYAGFEARYLDRAVLRVLRYDNRADPTAFDSVSKVTAWRTRFDSAGLRVEGQGGWTAIAQWLDGRTYVDHTDDDPEWPFKNWPFKAWFGLVSKRIGRHMLSARYDRFEVDTNVSDGDGAQGGHAWTVAYTVEPTPQWRFTLEWLRVVSDSYYRGEYGGNALATETQIQLAIRFALGSAIR